jgi:hypothetical protein
VRLQGVQQEKCRAAAKAAFAQHEQRPPVEPVREHPAVQAEDDQRHQFHRAEQADRERGPGELPGLDQQGDLGGVSAQDGDSAAGEKQPEVA